MPYLRTPPMILVCFALLLSAGGCATTGGYAWDQPHHGLMHRPVGQARSLVLDSPRQATLTRQAGPDVIDLWYLDRNDVSPSVVFGERVLVSEISFTRSRDSQSSSGGEVSDRFQASTFNERVIESRR